MAFVLALVAFALLIVVSERSKIWWLTGDPPGLAEERPVRWLALSALLMFAYATAALAVADLVVDGGRAFWVVVWPLLPLMIVVGIIHDVRVLRQRRAESPA